MSSALDRSLGANRRIKNRNDFLRIQDSGVKEHATHLLLVHSPSPTGPSLTEQSEELESRIGVTITRKVDKRAARRNRLRRRVKEAFRHLRGQLNSPTDIVVIAKRGATELTYRQVMSEFAYLLRRAKLLPTERRERDTPRRQTPRRK